MKAKFVVILLAISIILSGCGSDNIYVRYYHNHPDANIWRDDQILLIYEGVGSLTRPLMDENGNIYDIPKFRQASTDADMEFVDALFMSILEVIYLREELHGFINNIVTNNLKMSDWTIQETHRKESKIYIYEKTFERAIQEYNSHETGLNENFFTPTYLQQVGNEIYYTQLKDKFPDEYSR